MHKTKTRWSRVTTIRTHLRGSICAAIAFLLLASVLPGAGCDTNKVAVVEREKRIESDKPVQAKPADTTNAQPSVVGKGEEQQKTPTAPDADNPQKRIHAFVTGKVQGVGFRAFTTQNAQVLKLTGWVKNLNDGRVELVAEGRASELEKLMKLVAKGPAYARVDKVEQKDERYTGEFKSFQTER